MRTRTSIKSSACGSLAGQFLLQAPGDLRRHEAGDVAAERRDLLDSARTQERVLRAGHQVDGFDLVVLQAVEVGHLLLVLEVADRAQALDDRRGPLPARELDDQDVEAL